MKNIILIAKGKVRWCSPTVPGRGHDKTVTEKERLKLPREITVLGDSGFCRTGSGRSDTHHAVEKAQGPPTALEAA